MGEQFEAVVSKGGTIYECFIRAAGKEDKDSIWFPVGPMAVLGDEEELKKQMWAAEQPLRKAGFNMYPQLTGGTTLGNCEYGYRPRDAPKITEKQIQAANVKGEKLDPFSDVVLL